MENNFYSNNRLGIGSHLSDGDLMLFFSGNPVRKTADEDHLFFTNRNFLYLTGVKQEQSALLLRRAGDEILETLFVLKPDVLKEIWTGRRFTESELHELSGISQIEDIDALEKIINSLLSAKAETTLWLCFDGLLPEQSYDVERQYATHIRKKHPHVVIKNSYPLVCAARKIKTPGEIAAIRKGMAITEAGIRRMMRRAKPGLMEYELEAEFNAELAAHGQRFTAFPSIIASGNRIFYLHYAALNGCVENGDLILADVGAAYDEYCTDISRVFPSNGRFSERQAQIYQIALEANRAIMSQICPNTPFSMPNRVCREVVFNGLKLLGLIDNFDDIGKYVWHGVTHHVGLNTHDVGGYEEPMAENMVFTVDAGIYIREWGIGLRIEDNVLVTADGCENLSEKIPTTIEEIETFMAQQQKL